MKIEIWSDFACPFCYMVEAMLEDEIKGLNKAEDVVVEMRAYQLSPDAPIVPAETMLEHFMAEHKLSVDEAEKQMERITKMARRAGLEYNLSGVQVCSTFDAHRLMKLAYDVADNATAMRLNLALFHANFIENRRLSDHTVLRDIAVSAGIKGEDVDAVLSSDKYAGAVKSDEMKAEAFDLEYIPYMRFSDGRVLQGVLSRGALRTALQN